MSASIVSAELGLRSGLFDAVVVGEGEEALLEFVSLYRNDHRVPRGIAGIKTVDECTGVIEYSERRQMRMEAIPTPSFEEMPLMAFQNEEQYRSLPYQLSRGCTDKCSFCSEWVFWKHYRSDSPDHAIVQIRELLRRYNANFIEFSDSLLNGHPRRLIAFAEQVISENLRFGWTSFMRAQMDAETARLLKRSGRTGVFVGIESFSDEALVIMNKRRSEAENVAAVRAFVEAGIHVTAGFIPGFPGDSRRGFMHSVAVLRELQDQYPGRIELHQEPFTVMANAPMLANLAAVGLEPRYFAPEFLEIDRRYSAVAAKVLCSVEGNAQGLERIGRMKLVGAVKIDAPVKGTFEEGFDDVISLQTFEFEYLYGGWHLASKKSAAGHRFCLLVNDLECEELRALQEEYFPLDKMCDVVCQKIRELQARHVAGMCIDAPRIVRARYQKDATERCLFTISPFIVARKMGWRYKKQVLAADTVSGRHHRVSPAKGAVIEVLARTPHTLESLWRILSSPKLFRSREALGHCIMSLQELGILVSCDAMAELELKECDPRAPEIAELISALDDWQIALYPVESRYLDPPSVLAVDHTCFIAAYKDGVLAGCGAIKLDREWGEIKRMFVRPEFRRRRLASRIANKLETVARQSGKSVIRLETGVYSLEALALYRSLGFREVAAFPPYPPDRLSVFMEKAL